MIKDGPRRDLAFLAAAALVHGALLLGDPALEWGAKAPQAEPLLPIELVEAPAPNLAPVPPAETDAKETSPAYGPGAYRPEAPKAGAPETAPASKAAKKALTPEQAARRKELLAARAQRRADDRRRRRELERQLAQLPSPDDELQDALNEPSPSASSRRAARPPQDAVFDPEGQGGEGAAAVRPAGGGAPRDGGGVAWSLEGPVGSRRLLQRELPACPDWVSERGLNLTVQVRFQVLEDGTVKPGVAIRKTSGFPELDRKVVETLERWRFEPAAAGPATWGLVTFRFTMG